MIDDNLDFDPTIFIAPTAVILGDVTIGKHSSIWFNTVIRGDVGPISIGENSNIQDASILHPYDGKPVIVGDNVTVGHCGLIHASTVKSNCLIGIGAKVLNECVIEEYSIVGAGAIVMEGTLVPPYSLVLGVPGKIVGQVDERLKRRIEKHCQNYLALKEEYLKKGV
ncbi:MAG: gamma carbonic anhydrase family protein [Proteobacteria bacterium]|nr:gamma carbonic anhydrase family protein [Pseudomonadota bacterium]